MDSLVRDTKRRMDKAVLQYSTGKMSAREFEAATFALLEERHTRAAVLGRQRAGDPHARYSMDELFGRMVMMGERQYLRAFTDDLIAGRYTDEEGNPKVRQIRNRLHAYTGRLVGTSNETFVGASIGASFDWVLGGAEKSCSDCPDLAANGPYRWDKLPTVPRANSTQCLYRCLCHLRRNDGVTGFMATE